MKNIIFTTIKELKYFLILWMTQAFSSLGSSMTSFALVIWVYQQQGSALSTALLSICSYAPYVLLSIFAGAFSDRCNQKAAMLLCDSFAAACTLLVLLLLTTDRLQIWHLYVVNTLNGAMNTIQQPASDVAISLLCPQRHYQRVSGMRCFSNALVTVLTPALATALLSLTSLQTVIFFDLATFFVAFGALLFFIKIPNVKKERAMDSYNLLQTAKSGIKYLLHHRGILDLILFLALINFTASIFQAALPVMLLSREGGGNMALGMVNTVTGIATIIGSIAAATLPAPKSRVKTIFNCLLFSMSTENFILAFGKDVTIWCVGAFLGWVCIPVMNTHMDVLLRTKIPVPMQGRIYAARNSLQFFTIPLGYLLGGFLIDSILAPFMIMQPSNLLTQLFGTGKGAAAAFLFFVIGVFGMLSCLPFRLDRHIWELDK